MSGAGRATSGGPLAVERVHDAAGLAEAHGLRFEVFVDEQDVPAEEEVDALDTHPTTTHVLVRDAGGVVVGTGRLLTDAAHPGEVHVGRVAVARSARGLGVGAVVMAALERIALDEHAVDVAGAHRVRVLLSAQVQAAGFYERQGYEVFGPVYLDADIDHRDAVKVLER
ncbi:putative GNAT family N-acyltransferase [Sediminihabitans luteus]|uniref:Putative GNAT family N-acyltransferase n=1 Tax=Sediminihabitans luteus TaxID=1138585 RepID=A0A2M9CCK5_9CELL|nr:GNAT family N-acetyltransferase [Sediminihabitans luteus]PJJ69094.1 putative GNAT family N-acyltransferase [Sediminihabitans luteus]GII99480.1 acetyltransferase [Sediminihabitans luteus]